MREAGTARGALLRGLRCRSPLVLVAAALLTVAVLAGVQWFVSSGAFTMVPERLALRIPNDDYVNLSYRVAELRRHPPAGRVVYLFGGSGTMEMIRSPGALATAIAASGGPSMPVISLAAHNQSIGQTLAIIDNLPRGSGLLAIGLSPNRLITAPSDDATQITGSPLALTSARLAAALVGRAHVSHSLPGLLPGIFDFVVSYADQRIITRSPDLSPITYATHYHTGDAVASLSAKLAGSPVELARERPLFAANAAYNLALLADAVRLGREKGYTVAFFQQPLAPVATGLAWDAYLEEYRADVASVAQRLGVPDVAPQARAHLRESDFFDMFHLVDSGRDKWTPPLARGLARVLESAGEAAS
jgi:hypothetical protein